MPALNFSVFVDEVESGEKRQTIRATRKRPIKAGDTLYLYTQQRTKNARLLRTAQCVSAKDIFMYPIADGYAVEILVDGKRLGYRAKTTLAKLDGFTCVAQMTMWFEEMHGLPFSGQIIRWR